MAETLFAELKRYVGFGPEDESALRALHPLVSPEFARIADVFYQRILDHEEARQALAGESQVGRLKLTLVIWMDKLLTGPWDEAYYDLRARIGRVHVRISLPFEATPRSGWVKLECRLADRDLVFTIEDSGAGIPADAMHHIFEPFFTTKPSGSGLGLPIVHSIVTQHAGSVGAENVPGGGAPFTVRLPRPRA